MADLTLKRHDTYPAVKATLEALNEGTGKYAPIDLTGSLKVTMIMKTGNEAPVEIICTYAAPEATSKKNGAVEATFSGANTAVAGAYQVEFEIEWGAGKLQTVPNGEYREILIMADLGTA